MPHPRPDQLLASPDQFLFAFERDEAVFVTMDRAAYRRSVFLDARISPVSTAMRKEPMASLAVSNDWPMAGPGWIFHVAHCGSTLLARAIDLPQQSLVLREPLALRQLGAAAHETSAAQQARLDLTVAMLGRQYRPDAPAIVKANVPVNFIIPQLMARNPGAPAILLYFPFEQYLQAILRGPNHRQWVTNITAELRPAIVALAGDIEGLGDAERAAVLWLAQMRLYEAALAEFPNARSLDADQLFNLPTDAIEAAARLFGVTMPRATVESIVGSSLFGTYSKNASLRFSNADRLARRAGLAAPLAPEIERARARLEERLQQFPLGPILGAPLFGQSPALLKQ